MVENAEVKPLDRDVFFPRIRASAFRGAMTQSQVDGLNFLLDEWTGNAHDNAIVAYMLATVFHETAATMRPIEEFGRGRGKPYGVPFKGRVYYGRGYVQLTWRDNYEALGRALNIDLVDDPDLALDPKTAASIAARGMAAGMFTGHKLLDYMTPTHNDFLNARRIINGMDCAALIAGYAYDFLAALGV